MSVIDLLAVSPIFLITAVCVLGLMVGSFLNVVIYRLPVMMQREWHNQCHELLELEDSKQTQEPFPIFNLMTPRSHCPACHHLIGALENIPVLSYLLQRGRCKHCHVGISIRYPIIETVTALLSALVAWNFGFSWLMLSVLMLTWGLIALTMIDFDHQLLPDQITLPLLWLGLLVNSHDLLTTLPNAVYGAAAGYMVLWSIYWLFKLLTGKEGMGYGDFKLLAMLGAWMGWQALPQIVLLSSLVGAVVGITLILVLGRDKNVPIPFGPYLASAGFISLIWGGKINALYFNLVL